MSAPRRVAQAISGPVDPESLGVTSRVRDIAEQAGVHVVQGAGHERVLPLLVELGATGDEIETMLLRTPACLLAVPA